MVFVEVSCVSCLVLGVVGTIFYYTCIPGKQVREVAHSILYEYYDSEFIKSYTPPENAGDFTEDGYSLI